MQFKYDRKSAHFIRNSEMALSSHSMF